MGLDLHGDDIVRDRLVTDYLYRRLRPDLAAEFENHYLGCDDCFEELQATALLIRGLAEPVLERRLVNDVTVLRFAENTALLAASLELAELTRAIRLENDTKVLIDLSRVSRIDSAGLGVLVNCYCHAVKNAGVLKLLRPEEPVRQLLRMTKIDAVVPTFDDEASAMASFASKHASA